MKGNVLAVIFFGIVTLCAAACEDTLRKRVARDEEDQALWLRNVFAAEVRMRERGQTAVPKLTHLLEQAAFVPGVEQGAIVDTLPGAGWEHQIGSMPPAYPHERPGFLHVVSPGYFEVMELDLLRGRDFSQKDVDSSLPVAIVNESYAGFELYKKGKRVGGEDPVGARIKIQGSPVTLTIIGVVQNSRPNYRPEVYVPYTQHASYSQLPYGGYDMRNGEPAWYLLARVTGGRKAVARLQCFEGLEFRTLEERLKMPKKPAPRLTAEGDPYIESGTSKDDLLAWYGVPERRAIQKGSLLTVISSDPEPMRSCSRSQPADEGWYWWYKEFFVVITDGEVIHFNRLDEEG